MANQSGVLSCLLLIGILCICGQELRCFATQAFAEEAAPANSSSFIPAVEKNMNSTRRELAFLSQATGNPIDDCWMGDPNWRRNRKRLADCGVGFGKGAIGGKEGRIYVVRDPGDDPVNPWRGTLRYGVIQEEPLWIIFKRDMAIQLKEELIMKSYKTIDGRGVNVHIANGPCITLQDVNHIIIHNIHIHDCKKPNEAGDQDGISIHSSTNIWIDHCSLSKCEDGLIDAVNASTAITISNNYFTDHNKVMLLGNDDSNILDKIMQITIAYNHFGEGLVQRMPRCRLGHFHIVNNDYTHWHMYAIGGSANPTILSQGNRFLAPADPTFKEVTKRLRASNEGMLWNWISNDDLLLNGAVFQQSGSVSQTLSTYSVNPMPGNLVGAITGKAGVLTCRKGKRGRC